MKRQTSKEPLRYPGKTVLYQHPDLPHRERKERGVEETQVKIYTVSPVPAKGNVFMSATKMSRVWWGHVWAGVGE